VKLFAVLPVYFTIPVNVPLLWKIYPSDGKKFVFPTVIVLGIGVPAV
jgi:hypothetical protein